MTVLNRLISSVVVLAAGFLALPAGCEEQPGKIAAQGKAPPATRPGLPASQPAAKPQPIPARALTSLEALKPPIAAPHNPPDVEKLSARAQEDVQAAEKHLAEKRFAAAVDLLERAAGFDPGNPRIARLLGQAYLALPNRGKALASLTAAVKAAPDDLETQLLLGQLAAAQQQNDQAIVYLRTALKCSAAQPADPRAAEALLTLSLLLDRQGYWAAALEGYCKLEDWVGKYAREYAARAALRDWALRPERLLSRQGALLLLLGKADQAVDALERSYRRDRSNGRTGTLLVEALIAGGKYAQAEKLLLDIAAQPVETVNLPRLLAALCRQSRDGHLPERFWQACQARHNTDPAVAAALAKAAEELGWGEQALAILNSAVATQPNDGGLWRILCRNYAQRGQLDQLLAMMEKALQADAAALDAVAEGIPALAAASKDPEVQRRFADFARECKSDAQSALFYLAGRLAGAKGKELLAADLYTRATEKKPDFFRAYEALLDSYIAQKRQDRVDRLLERMQTVAKDTYLPFYFRGKVAMGRNDAPAAIDALEEALKKKADDLPTTMLLADAYAAAGRIDNAIRCLSKLLDAHEDNEDAARRLFDLFLSQRQFREARALAGRLLRANPDSTIGRLMTAELALRSGQHAQAKVILDELSREAPDNVDVQILAVRATLGSVPGLVAKSEFDEATERLTRVLRAQPGNRAARKELAELLDGCDKTPEASGVWATLLEETPGDVELAQKYIRALIQTKQYAPALGAVEKFRKEKPDELWGRLRHLELLGELKRFDDMAKLAEQWIAAADDENVKTLYRQELIRICQAGKEYARALKSVEDWMAAKPAEARARQLGYTQIRLLALLGRYDDAERIADQLLAADPLSQGVQAIILTAAENKQFDHALKLLAKSAAQARKVAEDMRAVGKAVEGLAKKKAETDADYEAAVKKLPATLKSALAGPLAGRQYAEAIRQTSLWAQAMGDELRILVLVVDNRAKDPKQTERLRKFAEDWLAAEPQALPPRKALVALLAEAENYTEAEKLVDTWWKQLAAASPEALPAVKPPTTASAPAGPAAEPASQLSEAAETFTWLMESAVRLRISQQKYAEGLARAEEYLKRLPRSTELLALKSACLAELKRDKEALDVMEAALTLKPDDPSINNNLGYMYADRGVELPKAEEMLKKATAARPDEMAFVDSLAWVYYKEGRLREAGQLFQRMLADREGQDDQDEHAVILDHAGDTYFRLGWKDRAVEFWKRSLAQATKAKPADREEKALLSAVPAKIEALAKGREPKVAPMGTPVPVAPTDETEESDSPK
jgi:tetratricopeptide (TPR) repeat protein